MKELIKNLLKLSPIPLTKNHKYDIETKKIIKKLKPNFNSIDVGCHKGEILDLLLDHSPKGNHFGVEALPEMAKELKSKYDLNGNVTIFNFAASNKSEIVNFNYVKTNPAYSGIKKRDYDRPNEKDETIKVQTEKLDEKIPSSIKIDLIKIDVEGGEFQVLEGAKKILGRDKPIVIFEHGLGASNHYGTKPQMIFEYFSALEFNISNLGSYIKKGNPLILEDFVKQYEQQKNHYFIAHTK